jgi:hypothetical protein
LVSDLKQNMSNKRVLISRGVPKGSSKKGKVGLLREELSNFSVTDPRLQELDPYPNLEEVFADCDARFFDNELSGKVCVKWSGPAMTW